jgi:uncharacterized C2H2 Zn-finger protein
MLAGRCKHKNPFRLEDDGDPTHIKWCPACGALFVRFETEAGHVSKRPKWILPFAATVGHK